MGTRGGSSRPSGSASRRAVTVALTAVLGMALMLVAAPTQAAVTCAFDAATGDVTLTYDAANQEIRVTRLPDDSIRFDHRTAPATD